jgi:hypothetical protein
VTTAVQDLSRRHAAFLIVLLLLGSLYFSTIRPGHDWGGDFSVYVSEARNLVMGVPFARTSYVPTEESARSHPAVYPPLTALVLAPIYAVCGQNYEAFKAVLVTFLCLSLLVYYALAIRRGLPPAAASLVIAVFGISSIVLSLKDSVGSDLLFLFLAGATLLFQEVAYQRHWTESRPVVSGTTMALLLFLCYLCRANGLALMVGFVLYEFLWRRRIRSFGVITVAIVVVAMVTYTQYIYDAGRHYSNQFPFNARIYIDNAAYYLRAPAALWSNAPAVLRYPLTAMLVLLAVLGYLRRLRAPGVIEFYVFVSVAILIAYTAAAGVRYAFALLPLVLMYAAEVIVPHLRTRPAAAVGCAAIVLFASGLNLRALETGVIAEGVARPAFTDLCDFLRHSTPADATILSWNPRVFALYTGRTSKLTPNTSDPEVLKTAAPSGTPAVLVVYARQEDRERVDHVLSLSGTAWRLIFSNEDFRAYERTPPPASSRGARSGPAGN